MFYNVRLFWVKSIFYNKFITLLLLCTLIIQNKSVFLIFKIALLLRFIDINKLCHPLQTFG